MKHLLLLLLLLTVPALAEWKVTWKPFALKSKTSFVQITGKLPVVKGPGADKINARLRAFTLTRDPNAVEKEYPALYAENHYTEEVSVEVTRLDGKYLSLQRDAVGTLHRGAHPSLDFSGITLNLATGEPAPLSDFVALQGLRDRIQAEGRKEMPDLELPDRKKWDWVLTKTGVRFLNLLEGHAVASFTVELPLQK